VNDVGLIRNMARRRFLCSTASGLGLAALASLLKQEGRLDAADAEVRGPHLVPRAKNGIFIFFAGGTSQVDLFDRKPLLDRLHGQPIPESFRQGVRLGQTTFGAPLMASPFAFRRYGRCGMELSELLPHLGSCADELTLLRACHHEAFDHAPAELEMCTGKDLPGRPSMGSWLLYGLGSESQNLPGYVVLINGRAPKARSLVWGNGFLPATYQGVPFRNQGSPILNLQTPNGISAAAHRAQLDAIREFNRMHHAETGDPRLVSQMEAYELAFRMQSAGPELVDLSGETRRTIEEYGPGDFARNLLLARRLVERGVRFVTIFHNVWDDHENIVGNVPDHCREVDRPVGAMIKDLKQRGLLDTTLVVGGTEFGRTAITQGKDLARAGRDHHPHAFSMWLAGGGVRKGQIVGATDELGWRPTEDAIHTNDFHATLLHLFGLDHRRLTFRFQGLDFRLTDVAGRVVTNVLQ
jgi:hypothetical protein